MCGLCLLLELLEPTGVKVPRGPNRGLSQRCLSWCLGLIWIILEKNKLEELSPLHVKCSIFLFHVKKKSECFGLPGCVITVLGRSENQRMRKCRSDKSFTLLNEAPGEVDWKTEG